MAATDSLRREVKVICADGDHWTTPINGTVDEIRKYFAVGSAVQPGIGPEERTTKIAAIEFLDDASKADLPAADTCKDCRQEYWTCRRCGASPMRGAWNDPPKTCKNPRCRNPVIERTVSVICCRRYNHHLGSTCAHCNQKD